MPANEFEKKVQKRLDDFQLNPSASVWKNVEEQIRQKKRRRTIFFVLLPFLAGILCVSIYYLIPTHQKAEQVHAVPKYENNSPATDNKKVVVPQKQSTTSPDDITIKSNDLKTVEQAKQKAENRNGENNKIHLRIASASKRHSNDKPHVKDDRSAIIAQQRQTDPLIKKPSPVQTATGIAISTTEPVANVVAKNQGLQSYDNQNRDQGVDKVEGPSKDSVASKADKLEETVNSSKKIIPIKIKSARKLKWGIDFSAGLTSNQGNVFSLNKSYNASPLSSNSPGAFGVYPGGAVILPPSSIKAGAAFRIGAVAELQLSARSSASIGLQYGYASNRIKTGTADRALRLQLNNTMSSMVDQVYRGPQNNSYTNSYHFLSMPLMYHWQIRKASRFPLQWNISISPGYLLSTDALIYSSSNGGSYYYDKNAINKFHFSAGTGLSLRLKGKKGMEYVLGPEISFDTRKLNNSPYERKQYLIYWGIGTRLLFPQKKK